MEQNKDSYGRIILWGVLLWVGLFALGAFMTPLQEKNEMFFFTLINVIMIGAAVMITAKFFKPIHHDYLWLGKKMGLIWTAIQLGLDFIVFFGVFKMNPVEYFEKIGINYVTIPLITMGMGYVLESHNKVRLSKEEFNPAEPFGDLIKTEESETHQSA